MRSRITFEEEFNSLSEVPGVFYPSQDGPDNPWGVDPFAWPERYRRKGDEPLDASTVESLYPASRERIHNDPLDLSIVATVGHQSEETHGQGPTIDEWLEDEIGLDIGRVNQEIILNPHERERIAAAVAELGTEALGLYLPWHQYARSKQTPWGIYLALDNLLRWAGSLAATASSLGAALDSRRAIQLAFFVAYRHELFHFHVERFATRQEILQRRPVYRPYDYNVFRLYAGSEMWLEEALAQAVVLESRLVKRCTGLDWRVIRSVLEREFDGFGPGYRDFRCPHVGGPDRAHRILAAQVARGTGVPGFESTSFAVPKVEYGADHRIVPGYLTWRPHFVSRFQFATPPMRKVRTWAQRNGFTFVGPGPGDHERWRHDPSGALVQFNPDGKESDIASLKAIARATGQKLRDLVDAIRST